MPKPLSLFTFGIECPYLPLLYSRIFLLLSFSDTPLIYNLRFIMEAMVETYTMEEVKKHNSKNDLWIVIHNKGMSPFLTVVWCTH